MPDEDHTRLAHLRVRFEELFQQGLSEEHCVAVRHLPGRRLVLEVHSKLDPTVTEERLFPKEVAAGVWITCQGSENAGLGRALPLVDPDRAIICGAQPGHCAFTVADIQPDNMLRIQQFLLGHQGTSAPIVTAGMSTTASVRASI